MKDYSRSKLTFPTGKTILSTLVLLAVASAAMAVWSYQKVFSSTTDTPNQFQFEIPEGESLSVTAARLEEDGIISSAFVFRAYAVLRSVAEKIRAGHHNLDSSMTTAEILDVLTGKNDSDEIRLTLTEGDRATEFAGVLEEAGVVSASIFLSEIKKPENFSEYEFLNSLPVNGTLEGFLFPDTYLFHRDSSAKEVLVKLLDAFDARFEPLLRKSLQDQNRQVYDAVTLASIIEAEVGRNTEGLTIADHQKLSEERRLVAGVFMNRLAVGPPLQSDATLGYATGEKKRQLSAEDIQSENAYNTYQHNGLPPTPIGNPSLDSLRAAVNPAATVYFYFLSKPDGEAVFARTLEEHSAN